MATSGTIGDQVIFVGRSVSIPFEATSDAGGTLSYSLEGAPSGLIVSNNTISGTAYESGDYEVTLYINDTAGLSTLIQFIIYAVPSVYPQKNLPLFLDETTYPQPYEVLTPYNSYTRAVVFKDRQRVQQDYTLHQNAGPDGLPRSWWTIPLSVITGITWFTDEFFGVNYGAYEVEGDAYINARALPATYVHNVPNWETGGKVIKTYLVPGGDNVSVTYTTYWTYGLSEDGFNVTWESEVVQDGTPPPFGRLYDTEYVEGTELDPTSFINQAIANQKAAVRSGEMIPPYVADFGGLANNGSYIDTTGGIDSTLVWEHELFFYLPVHSWQTKWYMHMSKFKWDRDPLDPNYSQDADFLGVVNGANYVVEIDFENAPLVTSPSDKEYYLLDMTSKIPPMASDESTKVGAYRDGSLPPVTDPAHYDVFYDCIPINEKDWNSLDPSPEYDAITIL